MNQQLIEYVLTPAPVPGGCVGCAFGRLSFDNETAHCYPCKAPVTKVWAIVPAGFSEEQKEEV